MGTTTTASLRSRIVSYSASLLLILVILGAVGRFTLEPNDRTRCDGMLNDGWWLDDNYTHWQPSGCMMHTYKPTQIATCLNHSHVLYVGDSIMREQFYSMSRFIHWYDVKGPLHIDRKYEFKDHGLTYEFWWDPFINSTRTLDMLSGKDPHTRPSLLVIGSGVWYMRHLGDKYFDEWQKAVNRVFDAVQNNSPADAVLLSPVEMLQFDLLTPIRQETLTVDKINTMNAYLKDREASLTRSVPFSVPFVWNNIAAGATNMTLDGLHYLSPVTGIQAELALNFRCNEGLGKEFPMDHTCCYRYPAPHWYQFIWFIFFLLWIPLGFYLASGHTHRFLSRLYPSDVSVLQAIFVFGLSVIYMYFGDRTHIFAKAHKYFDVNTFAILMFVTLLGGLVSLRSKKEGDQGFLNRAQTNEWKGWMQVIILVYHFTGASGTPGIYNAVRVLVAAYLFQTGYGHFTFFYKKSDFGISRLLNVMVRLNLLTFVLEYVMDTNYISYYFTPLVSFWFLVIWLTMWIGHSHNKKWWFIVLKLGIMSIFTGLFIHQPGVLETLFDGLKWMFNIDWNAGEWRFRLALDAWIVYIGMLCAYAYIKYAENSWHEHRLWTPVKYTAMVASVLAVVWYFIFELSQPDKATYNKKHPYISWIPILAFIVLRNTTQRLRNTTSAFYEFIGTCSLETFIGQFHMWLAADTKGLLVVLPWSTPGIQWWVNLAVSSFIFVVISHHLSEATGVITRWICSTKAKEVRATPTHAPSGAEYQALPLLPTSKSEDSETVMDPPANHPAPSASDIIFEVPKSVEDTMPDSDIRLDEEWGATEKPASKMATVCRAVYHSLWLRTVLFLIGAGIINRFC